MKKINYILFILVSIFIFGYKVNALSIPGDGKWHNISYSDLKKEDNNFRGTINECSALSSNIEVKKNDDSCSVKSKSVTNSDVSAQISVKTFYNGSETKFTFNTTVTKSSSSSSSDSSSTVNNSDDYFQICDENKNPQMVAAFKLIGIFLAIIKIIVPIILIIMGSLDMSKAVISKDNDAIQKSLAVFIKRSVAGILVFFAPSIILAIFHMVDGMDNFDSSYKTCVNCILSPKSCPNVSFKGN